MHRHIAVNILGEKHHESNKRGKNKVLSHQTVGKKTKQRGQVNPKQGRKQ